MPEAPPAPPLPAASPSAASSSAATSPASPPVAAVPGPMLTRAHAGVRWPSTRYPAEQYVCAALRSAASAFWASGNSVLPHDGGAPPSRRPGPAPGDKPLIKEFIRFGAQFVGYRDYASKAEEKLAEANERANTLAQKLEQSEEARKKAESDASKARSEADKAKADAAGVEELNKKLHDVKTSLSEHIAAQSAREDAIIKRLRSQNRRFVSKTSQEFELEDPDNDPLLDALSFLQFHGTEAREGIDQAKEGLSRLFPYFFPKKEETATFLALAKCFNLPEDLGLKVRQENMKVVVKHCRPVADSQQDIDWTKVGDTQEMETAKWRSLIRAAKPNTKKILAYLGFAPTPAPRSSKPEV
ncbi:hypothetical protein QYE76_008426 [Lolium multiflorum]|uniref:Uncharacterized protein n=1 Tax=Lolium multiflorum TaxID=4521 RepID=A0AAD8X2M5_LOLMU|nr:hypothetical protein QYE76_008426 [Lolium multiflorum]